MAQDKTGNPDKPDAFGRIFELKGDMRQRDVAAWNRVYVAGPRTATADERQTALGAAIEAGWIVQPATRWEDVTNGDTGRATRRYYFDGTELGDMTAAEVFYYGEKCMRHFQNIIAVPKA